MERLWWAPVVQPRSTHCSQNVLIELPRKAEMQTQNLTHFMRLMITIFKKAKGGSGAIGNLVNNFQLL